MTIAPRPRPSLRGAADLTLVTLALSFAPGAAAQQPAPPDPLTPAAAVAYARRHSPAYRQTRNDAQVADAQTRAAWGAFLPSLSLSASTGGGTSTRVTGESDAGEPIRLPEPIDFTSSSSSQSIGLGMTLFEGGARFQELGAARASALATRARIHEATATLDARALTLYWQAVQRQRAIGVEEALLAAARERLDAIGHMVAIAAAGPEDVLGAEVDVAAQELALARARGEAAKAMLWLLEAIGAPLDVRPGLEAELPPVDGTAQVHADAIVARALETHPALDAARAELDAADESLDATRARRWPRITGSAGWGRSMGLSSYDALFEPDPQNHSFSFGLSASLPVFSGFQTTLARERAHAARDDARAGLDVARLAVERRVREALIDVDYARRALELAERSAELSRQRLEMAQERYRLGALRFTELQSVIERAAQAERQALDARFAYVIARVALDEATGEAAHAADGD